MWSPSRRHVRISQEWWEESNSKIFRETNILPPSFLLSSPQANDKSVVKLKVPVKHTGGVNSYWVRTQAFLPSHHSGQDQSASSSHGSHRAGFLCVALLSVPTQANLLMCVSTIPPPRECEMGTMTRLLSGPRAKWWQPIQPQHFLRHSVAGAKHTKMNEKDGWADFHSLDSTGDEPRYKETTPVRARGFERDGCEGVQMQTNEKAKI